MRARSGRARACLPWSLLLVVVLDAYGQQYSGEKCARLSALGRPGRFHASYAVQRACLGNGRVGRGLRRRCTCRGRGVRGGPADGESCLGGCFDGKAAACEKKRLVDTLRWQRYGDPQKPSGEKSLQGVRLAFLVAAKPRSARNPAAPGPSRLASGGISSTRVRCGSPFPRKLCNCR